MRGFGRQVCADHPNPIVRLSAKLLIGIPTWLRKWATILSALKSTDMLIVSGGGILVDHTTGPFGYPYLVLAWSILAKLFGCRLLFVSVGAGPIYHPLSRHFIKAALSLADYRSYRDISSRQYIQSIGFKADDDPVYPDLAFSFPAYETSESPGRDTERPIVGVGLMDYYGPRGSRQRDEAIYREYLDRLSRFVRWLVEQQYTVRLLIGDVVYDSPVKQDLLRLLSDIDESNHDGGRIIDQPILTVEQLLSQLTDTDVVISPRFHNVVLALMLTKPVISISYNDKFDSLMIDLGLDEYCEPIDQFDVGRLIRRFAELKKHGDALRPSIKEKIAEYRRALEEQYTFIFHNRTTAP